MVIVQEDTTNTGINPDTKSKTPTNTKRMGRKHKTKKYWKELREKVQTELNNKKIKGENKKEQKTDLKKNNKEHN